MDFLKPQSTICINTRKLSHVADVIDGPIQVQCPEGEFQRFRDNSSIESTWY